MIFEEEIEEEPAGQLPDLPINGGYRQRHPQGLLAVNMNGSYGRSIDPNTEQKVINHLKRKLNRRIERRLANILEKEDRAKRTGRENVDAEEIRSIVVSPGEVPEPVVLERTPKTPNHKPGRQTASFQPDWMPVPAEQHRDIFRRYNEYGDRVAFTPAIRNRGQPGGKPTEVFGAKPLLMPLQSRDDQRSLPGLLEPLPSIDSQVSEAVVSPAPESEKAEPNIDSKVDIVGGDTEEGGATEEHTTGRRLSESSEIPAGIMINTSSREGPRYSQGPSKVGLTFNLEGSTAEDVIISDDEEAELQIEEEESDIEEDEVSDNGPVSPVPTPHIFLRPTTREHTRLSIQDKHSKILRGRLDLTCPHDTRVAKLYISNTGIDAKWELRHFTTELYPKLKELCVRYGCELQVADMHWGMDGVHFDNHSYPQNCVQAVRECMSTSAVNFVTLASGRIGSHILPATISAEEFEMIENSVVRDFSKLREVIDDLTQQQRHIDEDKEKDEKLDEDKSNKRKKAQAKRQQSIHIAQSIMAKERDLEMIKPNLLDTWYKRDDNVVPPVYRLQRISMKYPDINKSDPKKRAPAVRAWNETSTRIINILQKYSKEMEAGRTTEKKFFSSLLELEIEEGVNSPEQQPSRVCWFRKEFDGIKLTDEASGDYLEKEEVAKIRAEALHDQLRSNVQIPKKNRETYGLDWIKEGFVPEQLRNHMLYLEKLTDKITTLVKQSLIDMFEKEQDTMPADPFLRNLYTEIIQHVNFCKQRAKSFHGRREKLQSIKDYIRSDSRTPLLIHGKPGLGRKALVSKAAKDCHKWCSRSTPAVIFRSCGVTSESQNIRQLLYSISTQLALVFEKDPLLVPADFRGLVNDFAERITSANVDQPIVLFIDSLEQLSDEHDARKLAWLPKELPRHVKIVFSALPDEKYVVIPSAKKIWGDDAPNFLPLDDLPTNDASVILTHWLSQAGRTLTDDQYNTIMRVYKDCPNPLFLHCAFHEALSWTSYTPPELYKLAASVKRIVTVAIARLERDHSEPLVRRALGYITAAKKGVTLNELEDLLSMDDMVMEELCLTYDLKIRRVPPALLIRLRQDLSSYIVELAVDGLKTIQWSHVQFHEAAAERYLLQRDKAPSYHKMMAEYFMGTYAGVPKPTPSDEDGVLRYVATQSLSVECELANGSKATLYNKRALNELPFHFINSQQFDMLKQECLCNYEWLLAKLCGCGIRDIFDDYNLALSIEPKDKDLNILLETFQLSRGVLEQDPRQLGSQLSGRLRTIIMKDVPVTSADPKVYPACHPLMHQIAKSSIPTFFPSTSCLTAPGGAIPDILIGHKAEITAVAVTSEGMRAFSTSADNTMKMWDLRTGKVSRNIPRVGINVIQMLVAMDNTLVVTSESDCVRVWDVEMERCVFAMRDFDDYSRIAVSGGEGKFLICYLVGVNTMRSYSLKDFKLLKEETLERPKGTGDMDKEKVVMMAQRSHGDSVLVAYADDCDAFTQNFRNGELGMTLKCAEESARITALSISGEYYAVGYKFKYLKEKPYAVDIFATTGGTFVRTLRGCDEDNINYLMINNNGSHALCASASEQIWSSDIAVWNLETEEHKHLASHTGVTHIAALETLQYVVTACRGEPSLRVWNLSGSIIKPAPKMKQSVGIVSLVPMKDHPRYVVAASSDNGPLTVWNVAKGKTSGSAVRIEHGLMDPSDIVVIRNTKAVILSHASDEVVKPPFQLQKSVAEADRGIAGSSSIYQSVYVYDLRSKRYERKVPGIYIIPSRAHEFRLLSNDLLMGLSENRNQIYIWNLQTGSIGFRIKPLFPSRVEMTSYIEQEAHSMMRKRQYTAKMTPWDRRTETQTTRQDRHRAQLEDEMRELEEKRKEKDNGVEQFILSGDEKMLVASFFSHHMCVFDMEKKDHIQTLENDNSLLHLYVAALTHNGSHLVHTNYDEEDKTSYVTLWDCFEGTVRKRLRNEKDVCAIGISDNAERILFGKGNKELRIWEPYKKSSLRRIQGYSGMDFQFGMNKIFMLKGGRQAIIYAGDISMWDLDHGTVLAVYTPDTRISCMSIAMDGQLLCFGLKDSLSVVSLRLIDNRLDGTTDLGQNIFGERVDDDSSDEDEG